MSIWAIMVEYIAVCTKSNKILHLSTENVTLSLTRTKLHPPSAKLDVKSLNPWGSYKCHTNISCSYIAEHVNVESASKKAIEVKPMEMIH